METNETQIAKMIFHRALSIMKFTLNMEEYSYRERGREDPRFKTFKQQLMANTYDNIRGLLEDFAQAGLLKPTGEDLKGGYQPTPSGGSGYVNSEALDTLLKDLKKN